MAGQGARRVERARKVSNPRPSVLETAAPPLARAQRTGAPDVGRVRRRRADDQTGTSELPAHDGTAGIGKLPSSRLILMIEGLAGCARERADARQGPTLERSCGDVDACHRNDHCGLRERDMSTGFPIVEALPMAGPDLAVWPSFVGLRASRPRTTRGRVVRDHSLRRHDRVIPVEPGGGVSIR